MLTFVNIFFKRILIYALESIVSGVGVFVEVKNILAENFTFLLFQCLIFQVGVKLLSKWFQYCLIVQG